MTIVVTGEALVDLLIGPSGGVAAALGGGPFNTARTIARLGVEAAFAGSISRDRFGSQLLARLREDGVDLALVQPTDRPTTLAAAELDDDGAATYRFYVDGTSAPAMTSIVLPPGTASIHAGTLGLVLEPMATVIETLVASLSDDVLLMVDLNCRPTIVPDRAAYLARVARIAQRTDVIKVSSDDLAYLGDGGNETTIADLFAAGVRVVLHTDGGRAAHVRTPQHDVVVPVPDVRVVDTVGAGDAFGGGFLACWARLGLGRDQLGDIAALERAAAEAVRVAAATCQQAGAEPPRAEVLGGVWSA